MGLMKVLCVYPMALIVAVLAVFVGFLSTHPLPEGTLFATVIPLATAASAQAYTQSAGRLWFVDVLQYMF